MSQVNFIDDRIPKREGRPHQRIWREWPNFKLPKVAEILAIVRPAESILGTN